MNSKSKIYTFIALFICITFIGLGVKNTQEEKSKTLDHIILQTNSKNMIFEYSNKTELMVENPLNLSMPILSEDGIITNDKNIYQIKENRELEKINSLEGSIFYYKNDNNFMVNSSGRYLRVVTDNSESMYYMFDSQFNFLNCRQIVKYESNVLCLSTNLGTIFKLQKSDTALRFNEFEKSNYVISGLYNFGNTPLIVYQSYNLGAQNNDDTNKQPKVILKINNKEVGLKESFVYQVAFKDENYVISAVSETNLNNKTNIFEIYQLSKLGELRIISQNASGICIY